MMFFRSLSSQWLATAYVAAAMMLLIFFLGRYLGPENFGVFSYVHSLALIYAILQDGGFRTIIFRESATAGQNRWPVDELLARALGHLLLTTLGGGLLVCLMPVYYKSAIVAAIFCYAGVVCVNLISVRLKGRGEFVREAWWQMVVRSLIVLLIISGLFFFEVSVAGIFLLWGFGIGLALIVTPARQLLVRPLFRFDSEIYRSLIFFLVIDAATVLYFRIDLVLLQLLAVDRTEIGNYAAAFRIMNGVMLFMTPVAHICFRRLRGYVKEKNNFRCHLLLMVALSIGAAILLLGGGLVFSQKLISLTFGYEYTQAGHLLKFLFVALVFILPNYILTQAMIACEKEKFYSLCAVIGALINVLLNLFLIPKYGAVGAALATIFTEVFLMFSLGGYLFRWLRVTT